MKAPVFMSGLREEISKRFLRSRPPGNRPGAPTEDSRASAETVVSTDAREGRQFGTYRILKRLGSGGMGHVYLALDTELGRHCALKFISPELLSEPDMLHHLEQEARTASALNHPNILTIYRIGDFDGEPFIASEFVQGVTLKRAIQRGTVTPDMAIRIASQIASALTAAHSAGVIHRDLKPANVMVRPDGYVKVIDFGLAKLTDESAVSRKSHLGLSPMGSVVGTVDYMSPEQASGEEVDERTDIWSLGVLLYEMLSHQRPFAGDKDSDVLVAIRQQPAPPLPNLASLPPGVGRIVNRALMKDLAKRYQSAEEMLADLEAIDASSLRRRIAVRDNEKLDRRSRHLTFGVASAALLLAGCIWWWWLGGKNIILKPDWFTVGPPIRLTFEGRSRLAAISPDGKYLAYVVGEKGGMQFLQRKEVNQASEEPPGLGRQVNYTGLTFSPDNESIYEVEEDEKTLVGKLFVVPVVGQRPRSPLLEDVDGPVTFSPDGKRFAFVRYEHLPTPHPGSVKSVVYIMTLGVSKPVPLFASTDLTLLEHIAWAPDGKTIAVILDDPSLTTSRLQMGLIGLDGHLERKQIPDWNSVGSLCWRKDGKSLVLTAASGTEAISQSQLRQFAIGTGISHDLTQDLSGYASVSTTQDGRALAAVKVDSRTTFWLSAPNNFEDGQIKNSELQDSASLAWLDKDHVVVSSRRTHYPNLALLDIHTQTESTFTNEPVMEQHADAIPGEQTVVYCSNRSRGFHIWRYDGGSNQYTQLTFGSTYDDNPVVSPDGRWIVYTAWSSTNPLLYRVAAQGGDPIRVTGESAAYPQISPDGQWIACRFRKGQNDFFIGMIPFNGGTVRPIPNAHLPFRWSPDGKSLTSSITDPTGVSNLWQIPIDGSALRRLTRFDDQMILTFAWSPDGKRLAALREGENSYVVLLKRQAAQ